ncbi:unnamed protein product [Calicophoron daubneyi]|uniref:Uncharacterized protein n=1 Tax=Calicophoron daubneyi TaxID=300641 RepID=A0AAV2T0F3_CALDB
MNPNQPYDQQRNFSPYPQPGSAGPYPYPPGQAGMPQYGPQHGFQGPRPHGPGFGPHPPGPGPHGPHQPEAMFPGPHQPGYGPQGPYQPGPGAMGPYQPGPPTQQQFRWIHCNAESRPPPDAVEGEGGVYVIRHEYKGDMNPGKWPVSLKKGYISSGGKEIELKDFEVLCIPNRSYQWLDGEKGKIPPGAVVGGKTSKGETLYVARGRVNNEPCLGKVHPSHQCAYYPWGHKEHKREKYSVLCFL